MATIKLGPAVSDIRGSIGGTVFSRNRGGAYAKARIKGVNPNTPAQQIMRAIISSMFAAWKALTAQVRTDWGAYAAQVSMINRLGDSINLSAYNMYTRTKAVMDMLGISMVAAAPTVFTLAEQDGTISIIPDSSSKNFAVSFSTALAWANEVGGYLLMYQSPPVNPTVNSYTGPYRYIGKVSGAATPPTSPATIASIHTLTVGQKVFCMFRVLRADGRLSNPFRFSGTVVA